MARAPVTEEKAGSRAGRSRWLARIERARDRLQPALPTLRVLAFVVAVGIVVVMAATAVGDVELDELTWWPLPLALVGVTAWWILLARGWALLASGHFGRRDVATWCRTQTLRYLPGGVWAPASRATVLHGRILDRISTVAAENVIALCAALAVGGVALAVSGAPIWLPLVLAVGVPALASRFVSDHTRLAPERTHRALLNYLVAFAGYSAAATLVQAAVSGGFSDPFEVAGVAAVAWGAGLVVVIAPGGVGVRELVYVGLLSHAFPDADLTVAAVTLRGLTIVVELGVLLVAGRPEESGEAARRALAQAVGLVRRHAVFAGVFTTGLALRVLTAVAYTPGIVYYDSVDYLRRASNLVPGEARPLGYSAFLRSLPGESVATAPVVQHALGLAVGVMVYLLLCRLGVRRWAAALAAAPVLLDAYQLLMEQYVLSETLFFFLVVAACTALLWQRRPEPLAAGLAGAFVAGAALTRANGVLLVGPLLVALLLLRWDPRYKLRDWARASAVPAAALLLAFAVPAAAYAGWFASQHGSFGITSGGGNFLYGRVSPFVDCRKFSVPAEERVLCPGQAVGHRPRLKGSTVNWYTWANYGRNQSPRFRLPDVPDRGSLPGRFARRAILAQPGDYLRAVSHDFLRGFAPIRARGEDELPISRWQFSEQYPVYSRQTTRALRDHGHPDPSSHVSLTRALREYQRFGFTWGPVLAACLLAALLAVVGVGRARRSGLRTATFLFAALALVTLGSTVALNTFSWRYQLILVVLLPPAGALGLSALLDRRSFAANGGYPEGAGRSSTK